MSTGHGAEHSRSAVLVGALCYLTASLFWGLNIPLTASLFKSFDPFWLAAVRVTLATGLLAVLVAMMLGARHLRAPIAWPRILLMSGCVSCFFVLYNLGLLYTNTITAAALMAGSPVYGAITSRIMIGARLEKGFWGAAVLTILGAGIAIWGRSGASGQGLTVGGGEPLIILSFVAWTAFSILSVRWFPTETPQMARHFLTSLGAIPWLVLWWLLARALGLAGEPQLHPDATAWTYLLITAAFSTALGGVAWNFGVARLGINAGVMWQNTVPVFAVLIALIFFGQVPLVEQVIGGAVVLAGVLYMQWHRLRAASARGA